MKGGYDLKKMLVVLLALSIITGCSFQANSTDRVRYVYTVTIKDKTYGLTDVQVPKEQIGEKIGNIPVDCSVPECAAPPGNTFYSIKGKESKKYVAMLSFDGETYYRWTKIKEA